MPSAVPADLFDVPPCDVDVLRQRLLELESRDLRDATVDELVGPYKALHDKLTITCPLFFRGSSLFRAVRVSEKPHYVKRISYPPSDRVQRLGRVNDIGQVVFYGSFGPGPCLYECDYQPGDFFTVSKWETTGDMILNHLGYSSDEVNTEGSRRRAFPDESMPRAENRTKCEAIFRDWQTRMFTQLIPDEQEYRYKLTIAMSRVALHPIADEEMEQKRGGLMYPSVAAWMNSDNVALLPQYVNSFLRLVKVWFVYISRREDPTGRYEILDTATLFASDGRIVWNGESTAVSWAWIPEI